MNDLSVSFHLLTIDDLRNLCTLCDHCIQYVKTVLRTRLKATDTVEMNLSQVQSDYILDTPTRASVGKRVRIEPVTSGLAVACKHAPWLSSDLVHNGEMWEMEAEKLCKALSLSQIRTVSKKALDSRWVPNGMMGEDVMQGKAWLVTKGFQATALTEGLIVPLERVNLWSSHFLGVLLCALNTWPF